MKNLFLQKAASHTHCDFIALDDNEFERYSYDCGILLAMMTITGISDSHLENIIIHNKRPILIDGEVCLSSQKSPTPKEFSALDPENGSMNAKSVAQEEYTFLLDITGKVTIKIVKAAKNVIYQYDKNKNIFPCQPNKDAIMQGYYDALELMSSNTKAVLDWFNQEKVRTMYVRFIPQSTGDFASELEGRRNKSFSEKDYEEYCITKLLSPKIGIDIFRDATENYNKLIKKVPSETTSSEDYITYALPPYPSPNAVIFANDNQQLNILSEYKNASIPVYYLRANGSTLYDFNGNEVFIPNGFRMIRESIGKDSVPALMPDQRYFSHKEGQSINGCKFYVLHEMPFDLTNYTGSYIWIKKDPFDQSELIYVNWKNQLENINVYEFDVFNDFINNAMLNQNYIDLSIPQIETLIKQNTNHKLFIRTTKLPLLASDSNADTIFLPTPPLQITCDRARKILHDRTLQSHLENVASKQMIELQPYNESLVMNEIALRILKLCLQKLNLIIDMDVSFSPQLNHIYLSSNGFEHSIEFQAMQRALKNLGFTVNTKRVGLNINLIPERRLEITMHDPEFILKPVFANSLKEAFEISLLQIKYDLSLDQINHMINKLKLDVNSSFETSHDVKQTLHIHGTKSLEFDVLIATLNDTKIGFQLEMDENKVKLSISKPDPDIALSFKFTVDFKRQYSINLEKLKYQRNILIKNKF